MESLASLLDPEEADKWNCKVQARSLRSDLDSDIFEAAQEQVGRGLLSPAKSKRQIDKIFGVGKWRAIRRRGLQQGEKVRGIDNARCSKTNMAAFLVDTIMTTSHDVAMQIVSWLFTGEEGTKTLSASATPSWLCWARMTSQMHTTASRMQCRSWDSVW